MPHHDARGDAERQETEPAEEDDVLACGDEPLPGRLAHHDIVDEDLGSLGSRRLELVRLELYGTGEPCGRVHPRVDGDDQPELEVDAEHKRDFLTVRVKKDRVVAVELAAILDLKSVFIRRTTASSSSRASTLDTAPGREK